MEEAGCNWWVGLAVGILASLCSEKAPFLDCGGSRNGAGEALGKVHTKTVGKVEVFPAQAGMSPPQCLNECPYEKGREIASGVSLARFHTPASMKFPPKRKGKTSAGKLPMLETLPQ